MTSDAPKTLERVLLVEDNPGDARLVERRLEGAFSVTVCRSLQSALDTLDDDVAALLLDLGLPDAQGVEGLRQLRTRHRDIPVVVLTGRDDEEVGAMAVREGAQDYLVKDQVTRSTLRRTIRYAIERKVSEGLRQRLHHADRLASIGQLAAGVAHELNNPSMYLLSNLERLGEYAADAKSDDLSQIVNECLDAVDRIRICVKDLSGFSRIDEESAERFDVEAMVRASSAMVQKELQHRANLRIECASMPPIVGDRARLSQALVNLLLNAAHAIDERGPADAPHEIIVRTRADVHESQIIIEISDTGIGMSKDVQKQLFQPFFTTKPPGQGTGLGLSLVLETVRRHAGTVDVESAPGAGATFTIRLPMNSKLQERPARARTSSSAPPGALRPTTLVIVDDEVAILRSLKRLLQRQHTVHTFESGPEALASGRLEEADVVISDVMMPDLDGPGFYEALQVRG
ncbi:MAG: response regulator, partial [Myxococcota bacterium]